MFVRVKMASDSVSNLDARDPPLCQVNGETTKAYLKDKRPWLRSWLGFLPPHTARMPGASSEGLAERTLESRVRVVASRAVPADFCSRLQVRDRTLLSISASFT
jgi:hypothetical protein